MSEEIASANHLLIELATVRDQLRQAEARAAANADKLRTIERVVRDWAEMDSHRFGAQGCAPCTALLALAQGTLAGDAELEAARAVVAAMRLIDKHVIGAYETDTLSIEPCDECGEMRELAAQALATYDAAVKARVE